jgi:hypothetical protein
MTADGLNKASHVVFMCGSLALVVLGGVHVWNEMRSASAGDLKMTGPAARPSPLIPELSYHRLMACRTIKLV